MGQEDMYDADEAAFTAADERDDGTMASSIGGLKDALVGHRIVKMERDVPVGSSTNWWDRGKSAIQFTLDDGSVVSMVPQDDCCAYTELTRVIDGIAGLDHIITDVKHDGEYEQWYILADASPVLTLGVEWSCGNPFYYAYGFNIRVVRNEG